MNHHNTKKQKRKSAKSFKRKAGELRLIQNRLHVIPAAKGSVPTGQTSTPKTIAQYSWEDIAAMRNMAAKLTEYHNTAVELLWRYKASRAMCRKLHIEKTLSELQISRLNTEISRLTKSISDQRKAETTSETGQQKTLSKNSGSDSSLELDLEQFLDERARRR